MAPPTKEFGKHRLPPLEPSPPVKRSGHVALLVMGTLAVGGGAYALMPHETCDPKQAGVAAPAAPGQPQQNTACQARRSSSSGSHWSGSSRNGFYGASSSSHVDLLGGSATSSGAGTGLAFSGASGGNVARGGFGGFGHSISAHFSGG